MVRHFRAMRPIWKGMHLMFQSTPSYLFANFLQLPKLMPRQMWHLLRLVSVTGAFAVALLLWRQPTLGLPLFWGLIIPALPALFMFAPGFWRNVCPLATSNQVPRRLGVTKALTNQSLSQGAAYPLGIAMLIVAVVARKLLFNDSGVATAALIVGAMAAALVGGLLFKGKSGWCSSICPLLPVQRLYGQTPLVRIANTQCEPCVGCSKNCYDFNPGSAYLADQYDADPAYRNFRRFFAGVFPGLVLGYYLVPAVGQIGAQAVVGQMTVYMALSLTLFTLVDLLVGKTRNIAPVLFAATAFSLYYWFAAPLVSQTLQRLTGWGLDVQVVGGLRAAVLLASLYWVARSLHIERIFLGEQIDKAGAGELRLTPIMVETARLNRELVSPVKRLPAPDAVVAMPVSRKAAPTPEPVVEGPAALRIAPSGQTAPLRKGQTLLDALEGCGANIQAGCRAGACGADPVAVTGGCEHLSPVGSDEATTLARLGHAANTRMACMARVRTSGPVTVELKPHAADAADTSAPALAATAAPPEPNQQVFDTSIRQVVIIGNGVAGLTAADHVRRGHPECEIHLVGRENHSAYNRMAIAKLISTPAGMGGLQLLPEQWYAEQRVKAWLNTHAAAIDTAQQQVHLATGETLSYDRLILAQGSAAWVPPFPGFGVPGSFVLREADDAMAIRDDLQRHGGRHAVVVGAGLLGLEAAQALSQLGVSVQVVSNTSQLLDRQIDQAASDLLVAHLQAQGIGVVTSAEVVAIEAHANGRCQGVALTGGRRLLADAVVVCTGTRANLDLAHIAGLSTERGITVDAQMRTSAAQVWAAGDVAEYDGELLGLWAVALEQGEIAAVNALGGQRRYRHHVPVTALKVSGIDVRSAGTVHASEPGQSEMTQHGEGAYRKLVMSDGQVIGAVLVGSPDEAEDVIPAVRRRAPASSLARLTRRGRWARSEAVAMA